jgi:serine/threonine protein kinase
VSHPSICRLFAVSTDGAQRCLVLELCPGGPLDTRLKCKDGKHPPLQWQHRLRIAHDIACAVEHLHSLTPPMLHRDLKTANVLLDASGNAKVADFGTVREGAGVGKTHVSTAAVGTQGCECRRRRWARRDVRVCMRPFMNMRTRTLRSHTVSVSPASNCCGCD